MKLNFLFFFSLLLTVTVLAQEEKSLSRDLQINEYVTGTLVTPAGTDPAPLVILIQGSGPTDRNGNQPFMKNDSFKKLSAALAENGIASYRYDKRILNRKTKEADIRFDDFVEDAEAALSYFQNSGNFNKIIVLGHSQGSLVGMLAAKNSADAFISVAGAAQPIDSIITQQIATQAPGLKPNVQQTFREMREIGSSNNYEPVLEAVFRPSVQPFLLSWMKYDPREEISKLEIPVLIINGSNDLQVSEEEAKALQKAKPSAEMVILKDMNHIFRKIEGDALENNKSYNEPGLPLHPDLVPTLVEFIKQL